MNRLASLLNAAYHSVAVGTILLLLVAAGMGVAWAWQSGWIAKLTPPAPTIEPLKIRVHGSAMIVRGVSVVYVAEVAGPAGRTEWRSLPANAGNLRPIGTDGRAVEFTTLGDGQVTLAAMVAGQGLQIASDQIDIEIVDLQEEPPPSAEQPPMPAPQPAPHIPTVEELTLGALANVDSPDRAAEAKVLAGTIKSVIGRVQTGLLPPDADVLGEVQQQAAAALGDRYHPWGSFLIAVNLIVDSLRQQGEITTAASTIPTLSTVAAVLLGAK